MTGRLITLEGIDGVGKSTHAELLCELLRQQGQELLAFREPGSTLLGEQLRRLIKDGLAQSALAELLLFAAARAELVTTCIRPALARGIYVILDRFTDSTLAYQGALERIDEPALRAVCNAAADGLTPDLTFWLDLDPGLALRRRYPLAGALEADGSGFAEDSTAAGPGEDVIERRDRGYFNRVRQRYLELMREDPRRIVRLDASGSVEETAQLIRAAMLARLEAWRNG